MLSPKQIGTIYFAIFSFIFSAPLFATGIPSNASTADCKNSTLSTYSGTSNLQANWDANIITLHWYSEDNEIQNVPSTSQSCTYDGSLTPLPVSNVPTRTGYTFKGWRARQPVAPTCSTANLDPNIDGTSSSGSDYGNTWSVTFSYGTVFGEAVCSNAVNENPPTNCFGGDDTTEMAICSCRVTSYTLNNANQCNLSDTTLVEEGRLMATEDDPTSYTVYDGWCYWPNGQGPGMSCEESCALSCADSVQYNSSFRATLFGVSQ